MNEKVLVANNVLTKMIPEDVKIYNVSSSSEENYDSFPKAFHISSTINKSTAGPFKDVDFRKIDLKLYSCDYGADCQDGGLNHRMTYFQEELKKIVGEDCESDGSIGFNFHLLIEAQDKEAIYFVAAGNNGQELCVGVYLSEVDDLVDEGISGGIKAVDKLLFDLVKKSNLEKLYE